jgi:outer membrane receptor for ferrienterochelin and colicins
MNKKKVMLSHIVAGVLVSQFSLLANDTNTIKLEEVTVTSASGHEQKITDAPASISVISQEDLSKKPYTNLLDAVKDIEGIDIGETRDKSGQGGVSIRGMGADYTLILIDGKKQNNHGDIYPNNFGGFQYANIPPLSMIERIEVIRGPMSTLYGADAMGGVVNIITKKISNEWVGSFTQSQTFQSDSQFGNDKTSDFAIMGPLIDNVLGLSLRGSYYDKEASNPQSSSGTTFGGAGKTMDNQNWSAGAGLTLTPNENHTIKLDYDVSKQKYDNSEGDVGTVDGYETIYNNQRVGYAKIQRMEREQWALSHEAFWDFGKSTVGVHYIETANLGRSLPLNATERQFIKDNKGTTWADFDDAMADPNFLALMPRPSRILESKTTTYNAKYELPFEKHYVTLGAEYIDGELEDGVFGMTSSATTQSGVVQSYEQWALFAEDNWSLVDDFTITTGIRYDDHNSFGSHTSPRIYGVYNLSSNWTLKGGVGTGYKTPKTTDLFDGITGFGGQGTSPWVGNPDLQPEKSVNSEIALYYTHEAGHNFNLTFFKNDFKDKIESVTVTQNQLPPEWAGIKTSFSQKQNVGDATIQGVELAGKYQILDSLALKANHTYVDSKRDDTNEPLGTSAKHLYNATLDWKATQKFSTFIKVSGEKDRWRNNDDLDYYKDYYVFDLGSSYKLADNITFHARVNNLLDKDFTSTTTYTDDTNTLQEAYDYNLAQKRREFWLSMQVTF